MKLMKSRSSPSGQPFVNMKRWRAKGYFPLRAVEAVPEVRPEPQEAPKDVRPGRRARAERKTRQVKKADPAEVAGFPGATTLVGTEDGWIYGNIGLQWRQRDAGRSVAYPG